MPYQWQGIGTSATSGVAEGRVPNSQLGFTEPEDERFGFGSIGRGLLRGWEEIDKPLSERFGFRLPEMRGPIDEIGNFVLDEATRPTNALFALPSLGMANVAARGALYGSRAASAGVRTGLRALPKIGAKLPPVLEDVGSGTIRGLSKAGRAVLEPIAGYDATFAQRLLAETGLTMAASGGARGAQALLPDNTTGYAQWTVPLVGGLAGGLLGARGIVRGLKAAGVSPSLERIQIQDNMQTAVDKAKTPMGQQAMFAALQADNLLKQQYANRAVVIEKRKDALLNLSGLFEESGIPSAQGGTGVKNQLEWMEMLLKRNETRLKNQGYSSGMSVEEKLKWFDSAVEAGRRADLDPANPRDQILASAVHARDVHDQFHNREWYALDDMSGVKFAGEERGLDAQGWPIGGSEGRAGVYNTWKAVIAAKDGLDITDALINHNNYKRQRGELRYMGDNDGLEDVLNFGLGRDENLLRILALDDELNMRRDFHGIAGPELVARQASNPVFRLLHSTGLRDLNAWAAEVGARNVNMQERISGYVNANVANMTALFKKANIEGIFDYDLKGDVKKSGRALKRETFKVITTKDGDTGFDLTQKAVEEGRITQEQKDVMTQFVREAAYRYDMLKRAGIDPDRLTDRGGMHVRNGRRVSQKSYDQAQEEIEITTQAAKDLEAGEIDSLFGYGSDIEQLSPLAQEIADLGRGRRLATINTENPTFGDVLELGVYDNDIEELLERTGGAYFHREIYNNPDTFKLQKQQARRGVSDEGTRDRQATVDQWEQQSEIAATMDETQAIVRNEKPEFEYSGNLLKLYEAELRAFGDLIADAQLRKDIVTKGKTEVQLMQENAWGLFKNRKEVKATLSRTRVEEIRAQERTKAYDSAGAFSKDEQERLRKDLATILQRFLKLNDVDTPSSRGYGARGTPVEFEGDTFNVPRRVGDDVDAPVFPDADGVYPTKFDEQGQPILDYRGEYDVQDVTFRAQMKLDALNGNVQVRQMVNQVRQTIDLIDSLQASFLGTRTEYREVARRLGGLRSALLKAQDGVKAKKEFTTARGRRFEIGDSLQRNIRDMDDQILEILGDGWEIRQVNANELGLGRMPTGEMRRVYDQPLYGQSDAWAFHLNGRAISMDKVLENLESFSYDKNGNSRLRGRFTSKQQINEKKAQYNELFRSYVKQTEKVNGILNDINEVEAIYTKLKEDVASNVDQTNELNDAISGVIADNSVQAGEQLAQMLNNFDRAILENKLQLLRRQYDRNGVLANVQSRLSESQARKAQRAEAKIAELQIKNQDNNAAYNRALNQVIEGNLLTQVNGLSDRIGGARYFNSAVAKELQLQLLPDQMDDRLATQVWRATNAFNNTMRPVMATLDFSALGIQGLLAIGSNPIQAAQMFRIATQSLGNDKIWHEFVLNNYSRAGKGDLSIQAAVADGLHWSAEDSIGEWGTDLGTRGNAILNSRLARRGFSVKGKEVSIARGAELSNIHFSRTGNLMRYMMYQNAMSVNMLSKNIHSLQRGLGIAGKEPQAALKGLSQKERADLIQTINEATGWKSGKPKDLESTLLFAPRFFKSQLNILNRALKGDTPANRYARDLVMQTFAMGSFATIAFNEMRGEQTDYSPLRSGINGDMFYNSNFMRVKNVGGTDISIFGPWASLVGMAANAFAAGPLEGIKRVGEYKASPIASLFIDINRGHTFEGKEVFRSANPIDIMDTIATEAAGMSMPFSVQGLLQPTGLPIVGQDGERYTASPLFEAFGIRATPTTAAERRDRAVSEWVTGLTAVERDELGLELETEYLQYRKLTGLARTAFNYALPEHEKNIQESREQFAAGGGAPAVASLEKGDISANRMSTIEQLIAHYESGNEPRMTMSSLLNEITKQNVIAAEAKLAVDDRLGTAVTNPDMSDPNNAALTQFFALYRDPEVSVAPNVVDWNMYDVKYGNLYESWTPEQRRYVESVAPAEYPEAIRPYMEAKKNIARSGYYNVGNDIYHKNVRRISNLLSRNNQPVPANWTSFSELWTDLKRTDPSLAARLRPFASQMEVIIGRQKDQFIRQNPEIAQALVLIGRRTNPEYSRRISGS